MEKLTHVSPAGGAAAARSEQVADTLAGRIHEGTLLIGAKLPTELQLGKEFGVSRTVVREAVSRLKSLGLVASRQGSGAFVAQPTGKVLSFEDFDTQDPTATLKFLEIRIGLDAAAARLAASRRTLEQLAHLDDLCTRVQTAHDLAASARLDVQFHLAVVEAANNDYFLSVQRFLDRYLEDGVTLTRRLEAQSPNMQQEVFKEHQAILATIAEQDTQRAARAAEEHVLNAQNRLKYALSRIAEGIGR